MTQEEVAKRLGVSQQAVSKWFTGKSLPKGASLVALSKVLGKDCEVLLKEFQRKKRR